MGLERQTVPTAAPRFVTTDAFRLADRQGEKRSINMLSYRYRLLFMPSSFSRTLNTFE